MSDWPPPGMVPPRKPRTGLIIGVVAAVVIVAGGVTAVVLWPSSQSPGTAVGAATTTTTRSFTSSFTASAAPPVAAKSCAYPPTPDSPAAKDVGKPDNADRTPAGGKVKVTLKTNLGDIPMTLDRATAPCAVQSFLFLAKKKYYDGVPCHRLTTSSTLKVLQCGDPSGTGSGGPGYQFDDELPKGLTVAAGGTVIYPRGTVAMANAGPNTNGSQFFLVYANTNIPPNYPVVGNYDVAAQTTIDKIVAGGITSSPEMGPEDGAPKTPVTIQQAATDG